MRVVSGVQARGGQTMGGGGGGAPSQKKSSDSSAEGSWARCASMPSRIRWIVNGSSTPWMCE